MDKAQAEHHMERCVKSGLWVPDAKQKAAREAAAVAAERAEGEGDVYEAVA
jgi:hypothetical protein